MPEELRNICQNCPANKDEICQYFGYSVIKAYSYCNVANFVNTFYNNKEDENTES